MVIDRVSFPAIISFEVISFEACGECRRVPHNPQVRGSSPHPGSSHLLSRPRPRWTQAQSEIRPPILPIPHVHATIRIDPLGNGRIVGTRGY